MKDKAERGNGDILIKSLSDPFWVGIRFRLLTSERFTTTRRGDAMRLNRVTVGEGRITIAQSEENPLRHGLPHYVPLSPCLFLLCPKSALKFLGFIHATLT